MTNFFTSACIEYFLWARVEHKTSSWWLTLMAKLPYDWCLSPLTLWVRIMLRWGVLDSALCDKVCQWLATGRLFSPVTLVSSNSKPDRHNITEILLKVALNTINQTKPICFKSYLTSLVRLYWVNIYMGKSRTQKPSWWLTLMAKVDRNPTTIWLPLHV